MKFTKEEKFAKSSLDTKDGMYALLQTKQSHYHASQVCLLPIIISLMCVLVQLEYLSLYTLLIHNCL